MGRSLVVSAGADDAPAIVMTAADPANVFTLPTPESGARDLFVRPRGRHALLVTIAGVVVMIAERRGQRIVVRPDTPDAAVVRAAEALAAYVGAHSSHDLVIETIDGQPASGSRYVDAFRKAGFKRGTTGLRFYRKL